MSWWSELRYLVRKLNRRRAEREAEEEIQNHLDLEAREKVEAGLTPEEARHAARRAFGSVALAREESRAVWGFGTLEQWRRDLRYGARMLLKRPGFTLTAMLTLTLGIGANTAIFSVVHAALLQSLPYPHPERLVMVWEMRRPDVKMQNMINIGNFYDWKEQNRVFEDMAAFSDQSVNLTGSGEPEQIKSQVATTGFFNILGVPPILGRSFAPDDGMPGRPGVVVIGYGLWQRRFGGDPQIVGRKLILDGSESTVIGVMPAGFSWSVKGGGKPAEIWAPLQVQARNRRGRSYMAVARIKAGVTFEQAQAEVNAIHSRIEREYPEFNAGWGVNLVPLREQYTGEIRLALLVLLGAVGMVLLIACANVANLLLSRAASRQREVAVRAALGANRGRIIRQLLTESLLLAGLGGLAGLALAWRLTNLLVSFAPPDLLNLSDVKLNGIVLGFTLGISLLTGVIFGLAPAFEATRINLSESLKEGGKGGGGGMRAHRLRDALVIFEVALALALLVGAGLLIRSFSKLNAIDPGFNPQNVLTMRASLSRLKYDTEQKRVAFFRQAVAQMQALPGVEAAGAVNAIPFASFPSGTSVDVEGRPILPVTQKLKTSVVVTDANYFRAMRIPLKRGRLFTDQEAAEPRHVVIINEMFALKHFPNEDPLGKRVTIYMKDDAQNQPCEIIGIVGDSKHMKLDTQIRPMAYWPHPELATSGMTFVIRTQGDASSIASAARNVLRALESDLPSPEVRTMESLIGTSMARERFNTLLLAVFAVVALLIAGVGIYGVMAYSVAQQRHDIGVRMALGARKSDVLLMVVRKGMTLAFVGVAIGVGVSLVLTRLMKTLVFDVSVTDPATFVVIVLLLSAVALLACLIPARRATKVDPMVALRYE
jgi:putative ABC transport system permease protein